MTLSINDNSSLNNLPVSIAELPSLTTLNVSENPDLLVPQAICDWGEIDGHTLNVEGTLGCSDNAASIDSQRQALLNLYLGNNVVDEESQWDLSAGSDIGEWTGVTTNAEGNVVRIRINNDADIFDTLDSNLNDLPFLTSIELVDNGRGFSEDENINLPNLTRLVIEQAGDLPIWTTNQTTLTTLLAIDVGADGIPNDIGNLINLERLFINTNNITDLPDFITELENLQLLNVSDNNLSEIPESLAELPNLTLLDVRGNLDLIIPQAICDWGEIDGHTLNVEGTLGCSDNAASINSQREALLRMYDETTNLWDTADFTAPWTGIEFDTEGNVVGFNFNDETNPIKTIDENINFLTFLNRINATEVGLEFQRQDESIAIDLPSLESLSLQAISQLQLPEWIIQPNLTSIVFLDVLGDIPENIGDATQLTTFSFEGSATITGLPESFSNLQNLTDLTFLSTRITEFPQQILSLNSLETLRFGSHNEITSIPEELVTIESLNQLNITENNNLTVIPQTICDWGEGTGNTLIREDTTLCE